MKKRKVKNSVCVSGWVLTKTKRRLFMNCQVQQEAGIYDVRDQHSMSKSIVY